MVLSPNKMTFKVTWLKKGKYPITAEKVSYIRGRSDPVRVRGMVIIGNRFIAKSEDIIITRYYGWLDPNDPTERRV